MKITSLLKFAVAITILTSITPNVFATQYTAYSLKIAQQRIDRAGENWRRKEPDVANLAGINKVEGFVYDSNAADLILVGEHEQDRANLTLDDLVVALRARFRYNEWPLVSIDPTPDTEKTQMQHIRFEGGIQDTAFGQAMFDADYRLKEMGMGLQPSGVEGLRTSWDRGVAEIDSGTVAGERSVNSRLWFYPINPHVVVREGVCVVRGLKVGVFTEVLSAKIDGKPVEDIEGFKDQTGDVWANDVSERFEQLCGTQPSFNRLRGLQELVAVSKALEELEKRPDLSYWLEKYLLAKADTLKETKVLRRKYDGSRGWFEVSGGVHLTALAMRLNAGDVRALREAVVKMRPSPETLKWEFLAAEWLVSLEPDRIKPEDIAALFQQAFFLQRQKRFDAAIECYTQVLRFSPKYAEAHNNRGVAHLAKGDYRSAITDFTRALEMNSDYVEAHYNLAIAYIEGPYEYDRAIGECNQALALTPNMPQVYNTRGDAYARRGDYDLAVADLTEAIRLNPTHAETYVNRGLARARKGVFDDAIADFNIGLELNPNLAQAYGNRAVAWFLTKDYEKSWTDLYRARDLGFDGFDPDFVKELQKASGRRE
jgi:tetratricopeptide (TPR) repeat protein